MSNSFFLLLALIMLLSTSCISFDDAGELQFEVLDQNRTITLTPARVFDGPGAELLHQAKEEIFIPKCAKCHTWVRDDFKIIDRVEPGLPDESDLYFLVEIGEMPKKGELLSEDELKLVFDFISALEVSETSNGP
jgi:mono/diheme cytochrome c family protein